MRPRFIILWLFEVHVLFSGDISREHPLWQKILFWFLSFENEKYNENPWVRNPKHHCNKVQILIQTGDV